MVPVYLYKHTEQTDEMLFPASRGLFKPAYKQTQVMNIPRSAINIQLNALSHLKKGFFRSRRLLDLEPV